MGIESFMNVGTNPYYVSDWYEKNGEMALPEEPVALENRYNIKEKTLEAKKEINENVTKTSKLSQRKNQFSRKIRTINKLINKLNSEKLSLQLKVVKYNIKLSTSPENALGTNVDING